MTPDDVLTFWFGDWDDEVPLTEDDPQPKRWWSHEPATDADIRQRFGTLYSEIAAGGHRDWEATARGLLARVIVLDQFSRVIHRGSAQAFAHDSEARRMCSSALEKAWDRDLAPIERSFLYLPLMHAEDRAAHRRALMVYTALAEEVEELGIARADYYRNIVGFELRHKQIIDRFGRYPHRNFPLERTSTPEELAFLEEDGSSF